MLWYLTYIHFTFLAAILTNPGAFALTRGMPFDGNCAERNAARARQRKRKL